MYDLLGHVPTEGESVTVAGWRLTALRIQGRRIGRVTISPDAGAGSGNGGGAAGPAAGGDGDGDGGQVAGIEALPFGLLIFVVGALLVLNLWSVIDAKLAVDGAARESVRTFVEADVESAGVDAAEQAATRAGVASLDARGLDASQASVRLLPLDGAGGQTGFARCARATYEVRYQVPMLTLPWIGGVGDGIVVTSRHSELVDPLRSGVPGTADACR